MYEWFQHVLIIIVNHRLNWDAHSSTGFQTCSVHVWKLKAGVYIYIYVLYMYIIRSIELDSIILADLWHCLAKRPTTNPYKQFYKPQHLEA